MGILSSSRGREDVQRTRTDHGLGAIRGAQFGQEMLDMEFDGGQAEHLVLSLHTVKLHVKHLLAKLGATNRTQAVTRERALHILPPF